MELSHTGITMVMFSNSCVTECNSFQCISYGYLIFYWSRLRAIILFVILHIRNMKEKKKRKKLKKKKRKRILLLNHNFLIVNVIVTVLYSYRRCSGRNAWNSYTTGIHFVTIRKKWKIHVPQIWKSLPVYNAYTCTYIE